jgi:hypothetical protein
MPIIAAHAAAPQIHTVIFRYGLVPAGVPFALLAHTCRHQEAAAASRESESGYGVGAAASSWNRPFDRGQNPKDAQVVWRLQERGRFACDQRHRAETQEKMRKYITVGKSVAPKKQAGSVATSSKSPPRVAPKNLKQNPPTSN